MSKIQWTGKTWNPVVGCTRVSPGCQHCYAERMAKRLIAMGQDKYIGTVDKNGRWTGVLNFDENNWEAPLLRKSPTVYFVNSMSDLFHEKMPQEWLVDIWRIMRDCPQHTFQILTKRADLMKRHVKILVDTFGILSNVWLGVSVENQEYADRRIPELLKVSAAVRFLSCEPLLGPVDLAQSIFVPGVWDKIHPDHNFALAPSLYKCGINWVIIGGESGPGARPFHLEWARDIIEQCQVAGVAVFVKQVGSNPFYDPVGIKGVKYPFEFKVKDGKGGKMDEWPKWLQVREYPKWKK